MSHKDVSGSDGDVVIDKDTILTRDMYCKSLTINNAARFFPNGFGVRVAENLMLHEHSRVIAGSIQHHVHSECIDQEVVGGPGGPMPDVNNIVQFQLPECGDQKCSFKSFKFVNDDQQRRIGRKTHLSEFMPPEIESIVHEYVLGEQQAKVMWRIMDGTCDTVITHHVKLLTQIVEYIAHMSILELSYVYYNIADVYELFISVDPSQKMQIRRITTPSSFLAPDRRQRAMIM